jgi:hypothetical protein
MNLNIEQLLCFMIHSVSNNGETASIQPDFLEVSELSRHKFSCIQGFNWTAINGTGNSALSEWLKVHQALDFFIWRGLNTLVINIGDRRRAHPSSWWGCLGLRLPKSNFDSIPALRHRL